MTILHQFVARPQSDQDDHDFRQEEKKVTDRVDSRDLDDIQGKDGECSSRRGAKRFARQCDLNVGIRVDVHQDLFEDPQEAVTAFQGT